MTNKQVKKITRPIEKIHLKVLPPFGLKSGPLIYEFRQYQIFEKIEFLYSLGSLEQMLFTLLHI